MATVVYRTSKQVRVRLLQVGFHWPLKLQVIGLIMVTEGKNRRGKGLVLSSKLLPIVKINLCNSGPIQNCWKIQQRFNLRFLSSCASIYGCLGKGEENEI